MARDVYIDGKCYSTAKRPRWTFEEARPLLAALNDTVGPHGHGAMLYGSVLREGEGRDLDVMILPHRLDAAPMKSIGELLPQIGLSEVRGPAYGHRRPLGVCSWLWEDARERSVDIAFWPPTLSP